MGRPLFTLIVLIALLISTTSFVIKSDDNNDFILIVTGADDGVLEPCGCAGGQLGGLTRRATIVRSSFSKDEPRLILSTGGVAGGSDLLHQIRFKIALLCQNEMGYHAMGLGPEELALGLPFLSEAKEASSSNFILTNVSYPGVSDLPFNKFMTTNVSGINIRVLSIIPESLKSEIPKNAVFTPPKKAIELAIAESGDAELTVILMRGVRSDAKAVDQYSKAQKLIFYSSSHSEPEIYDFGMQEGLIRYLSPGGRGRFLLKSSVKKMDDDNFEFVPSREAIELRIPESDHILLYMSWYKQWVIEERVLETMVEIKPKPRGAPYIGDETCILCHKKAYKTWSESKHAHAYETLVKDDREFDPECISCHTTGFGYKSGYSNEIDTPWLLDVGCESCHGPCREHASSAGRISTPIKPDCIKCHNLDNSPEFDRDEYWKKIRCYPDKQSD